MSNKDELIKSYIDTVSKMYDDLKNIYFNLSLLDYDLDEKFKEYLQEDLLSTSNGILQILISLKNPELYLNIKLHNKRSE